MSSAQSDSKTAPKARRDGARAREAYTADATPKRRRALTPDATGNRKRNAPKLSQTEAMQKLFDECNNPKNNLSFRALCKKHEVSTTTARNLALRMESQNVDRVIDAQSKVGRPTLLPYQFECQLAVYLAACAAIGVPLARKEVIAKAKQLASVHKSTHPEFAYNANNFSRGWFASFNTRFPFLRTKSARGQTKDK